MKKTILKCGLLFRGIDETVEKNMAVTVEDNRIASVAPWEDGAVPADAQVIVLSDKFATLGLIHPPVHVHMTG